MTDFYWLAGLIVVSLVLGGAAQTYLLRGWARRTLPDEFEALRHQLADHGRRIGALERDVRSITQTLEELPGRIVAEVVNGIMQAIARQKAAEGQSVIEEAVLTANHRQAERDLMRKADPARRGAEGEK